MPLDMASVLGGGDKPMDHDAGKDAEARNILNAIKAGDPQSLKEALDAFYLHCMDAEMEL